ncbi:helix-turn-helix transcriptional regulator [Pseudalkalibacillus sp. SCS-8]|uniref:helix-turn-helix domain-containing protein n=1 Tax=Pseudalkalibacillus nanhaiensis TaxID=3115291 RepID=UPI0032DA5C67
MIGKNIIGLRKKKGLSLTELAERAGISKSYLSNIERDVNTNPSIQVLLKLAHVLQVDIADIVKDRKETTIDREMEELIRAFKQSGVKKEDIEDYRKLIDFIQWQKEHDGK